MEETNQNQNVEEPINDQTGVTNEPETNNEPEVTVESLMAEMAQIKAEYAKNKAALDKALKEKGEITKLYRAKQTAEEQEAEAKEEAEKQQKAYISDLETFKRTAEAKARYALQGMGEELAVKAAEAEISGDMDALATIQKQHTEALIKQREAEWLKSRPQPQAGTGGGEEPEDAFIKGFNSVNPRFKTKK
jgi:hypothetical protein